MGYCGDIFCADKTAFSCIWLFHVFIRKTLLSSLSRTNWRIKDERRHPSIMCLSKSFLGDNLYSIEFQEDGDKISDEILLLYNEVYSYYKKAVAGIKKHRYNRKKSLDVLTAVLHFYQKGETLVILVLNEVFCPNFVKVAGKRWEIYRILNKIFKMFLLFDINKLRYPEVFCQYSFFKMLNKKEFKKSYDKYIDQQISIISMIVLPFGRLVLSIFSSNKMELSYPTILGKRLRIVLTQERRRQLKFHGMVAEKYNLKYIHLYFSAVSERFFGDALNDLPENTSNILSIYKEMLLKHL